MTIRSAAQESIESFKKSPLSSEEIARIKHEIDTKTTGPSNLKLLDVEVGVDSNYIFNTLPKESSDALFPDFLPTWDPFEKYEPLEEFKHEDPGHKADPYLQNLFPKTNQSLQKTDLTPNFGSEIDGLQLSSLSPRAKDDLALYVAQRGVVIFRNQDLASKGPQFATEFGKYFGPLHIHPTSGAPKDAPALHLVYRPKTTDPPSKKRFAKHTNGLFWHTDITYEKQPAGTTFLAYLEGPENGAGSTIYVDQVQAYKRLSPEFQSILEKLSALHKRLEPIYDETNGEPFFIRREGYDGYVHPLVRKHPVTGEKSLFINQLLTLEIVGLKKQESDAILNFLYDHLKSSVDLQIKTTYKPGTVVVFDNRVVGHTWVFDWDDSKPSRRHLFRITPRAEVPSL
ncbi:Alpha-ketoglutarate-dependent sulfonate dioxygenase [Wickerhamomyces ciferrii]|uniref:Alpha-ketoglutarate-dependent sulfonate dioxygenase n=1 Tax=Wickerhamomyces ciferrii (strain ATCC 14091 / BCRC 22168 / CBS 111 / JCM 3599 / NBRC 0793 / NRRL Y-1031 F-60-10) TaxID=1206466 RepID=K0KTB8_WICCF|nr:Alpha-ketoglutarate-dependent sulfonate dioxygenase [Wickerhamomyces ciferrii]CCH44619.1 Alpha-ketoglutarate-dependent sulfonate dioxygenase [Wickerhamomyces ciferrii]